MFRTIVVVLAVITLGGCSTQSHPSKMRTGVWITDLSLCEGGNVEQIANKAKEAGLSYIIVRTHSLWEKRPGRKSTCADKAKWYWTCPEELFRELLDACHREGIKVYSWSYIYGTPGKENIEVAMVKQALDAGVDGYVANVEIELALQDRYDTAAQICERIGEYVEERYPHIFTSYSTFARIGPRTAGYTFPAIHFSRVFQTVMPQTYWATFNGKRGRSGPWKPDFTVREIDRQWRERYDRWRELDKSDPKDRVSAIRPLIHTGQAYAKDNTEARYIPRNDLKLFLNTVRAEGHAEVNVWRWDLMGKEHWETLREFSQLAPLKPGSLQIERGLPARTWHWIWSHKLWIGLILWALLALLTDMVAVWRFPSKGDRSTICVISLITIFLWWLAIPGIAVILVFFRLKKKRGSG